MLQIYLPVAEISVGFLQIVILGVFVGCLAGLFGIGGGFVMTPVLIFYGVPTPVAVSTQSAQVLASAFSGIISHFQRRSIDFKMSFVLLSGGISGSLCGIYLFSLLKDSGYISTVIKICYIVSLFVIGIIMSGEGIKPFLKKMNISPSGFRASGRKFLEQSILPFKVYFDKSGIKISIIPPILIGFLVGLLGALMGIGGAFILLPAMMYIFKMPGNMVVGTSLFNIVVVSLVTTVTHAIYNRTVDSILAVILVVTSVVGAQVGNLLSRKLKAQHIRLMLGLMILILGVLLFFNLLFRPEDFQFVTYN